MSDLKSNLRFIWRLLRSLWRCIMPCLLIAACAGCANLAERIPYACARHPYFCTSDVWRDCVCAPFKLGNSYDPIWTSFATLTWPFWLVDEVCEVALDTVFLPVDGVCAFCKDKPQQPQGAVEIVQEVPADVHESN